MKTTIAESDVADKIKQEHDSLRDKLGRIHSVLAGPKIATDQIAALLHEFHSALRVHFSNEEQAEGFFEQITSHAPRLSNQAGHLCVEHEELTRKAAELCQFAAAGCPSMSWWRELSNKCQQFSRQLMHHESDESKLLQQAYLEDISAND
jgi:hypothetical protein